MKNNRGTALLISLFVVFFIAVMTYAMSVRSMAELKSAHTSAVLSKAFYWAEGGLDAAIFYLTEADWSDCNEYTETGNANYQFSITCLDSETKRVVSIGQAISADGRQVTRSVEGILIEGVDNFFNSTLYLGDSLDVSGNANLIDGNITVGDEALVHDDANITGEIIVDSEVNTFRELDWDYLRAIAESQGNVYTEANQALMPTTFYYSPGIPNVVIFDDAQLNANGNSLLGGFIIINPGNTGQFVQNGNIAINGCMYVNGDMDFNGGGNRIIHGCVWAGDDVQLNGAIDVIDSPEYRQAIRTLLNVSGHPTLVSWRNL